MEKRFKNGAPAGIFLVAIFVAVAVSVSASVIITVRHFNSKFKNISEYEEVSAKLYELDEIVRNKYDGTIDETKLNEAIRRGYVEGLSDKNSRYITRAEYARLEKEGDGQRALFGVELIADGGYIKVKRRYNEQMAGSADFLPGDLIIKINEEDINAENLEEKKEGLWQAEGSIVKLVVRRGAEELEKEVVVRSIDVAPLQTESFENIGYVKIEALNGRAENDFKNLQKKLLKENDAVIFDLRGVRLGEVEHAAGILQLLLPQGLVVSSLRGGKEPENLFYSSGKRELQKPAVVLADAQTAGVAELFVQALKDYGKAVFVGEKTAGKGKIQEIFKLRDGSAVEITTAELLPPSGKSFDEKGVVPDVFVADTPAQQTASNGDYQLRKAVEILKNALKA